MRYIHNFVEHTNESITAYHGTPHKFDKFTANKIGTGEGNQSFGWGLYFTELESIAKGYANAISASKTTLGREYYYSEKEFEEYLSSLTDDNDIKKWVKRFTGKYISKFDSTYYHILHKDNKGKTVVDVIMDWSNNKKLLALSDKEFEDLMGINKSNFLQFAKNFERVLYKVSLHKGKTPNQYTWLEWDKTVPDNIYNTVGKKLKSNGKFLNELFQDSMDFEKTDGTKVKGNKPDGQLFYKRISQILGSDKEASLWLLSQGIDGIKYPAESIARGATSDNARGFNYVVFDENAVDIDDTQTF